MKSELITTTLGEICRIEIGKTPARGNERYWDVEKETNNIWLSIADLKNTTDNIIHDSKEYISESGAKLCKKTPKGTLLMSFKLTLGRLAFAGTDLYTNEAIASIYIRKEQKIYDKYLFYYLSNIDWAKITDGDTKVKGKTLNKEKLKILPIKYPESLEEQKRIVSILDKIFKDTEKAINISKTNLQNAKDLFEYTLEKEYSYSNDKIEFPLNEICSITSKLVDPRKKEYLDLYHVGGANIESNTGTLIKLMTAKEEKLISGKFLFDANTVLYSKIRPYLIKVARPSFRGLCSADIYPLVPMENKITKDYLFFLLLTPNFTKYAIKGSDRAGMPKVNRNHLFGYYLFLPEINKQQVVTKRLDYLLVETHKLKEIYLKKIKLLENLKKSVLNKAFRGEL